MAGSPLIELKDIGRSYKGGFGSIDVLRNINLTINQGEMIAIVGASGSGKSTLMNILGCLDTPTTGEYRLLGQPVASLGFDELSRLRRENFGFIFQRYNLLGSLSALNNVEMPAIYAGAKKSERLSRAKTLLSHLGMAEREEHFPNQLSGGQQQRVAIARALINRPEIILADEPTGALDSRSSEDVLQILRRLNDEGHTVIIVTHDHDVAAKANRIIQIKDGEIASDQSKATEYHKGSAEEFAFSRSVAFDLKARIFECFAMSFRSMNAHRLRAFLTMLGIIIGTASVVVVVGLGQGTEKRILEQINDLGVNALYIRPGQGAGDLRSGVSTLEVQDVAALVDLPFVKSATPIVSSTATARTPQKELGVTVTGVGADYFSARDLLAVDGMVFDGDAIREISQNAVIDTAGKAALFPGEHGSVVGRSVLLNNVPLKIVGVVAAKKQSSGGSFSVEVLVPYTTAQIRIKGSRSLQSIIVRAVDGVDMQQADRLVTASLVERRGQQDFYIFNTDSIQETSRAASSTFSLLIGSIGAISLFVGGIGVMNIMLVSVSERITEIGVRMAVGARRADILMQFLIEALVVCVIGGAIGIATALAFGFIFANVTTAFEIIYSLKAVVFALVSSSVIGIAFGFFPARNAARLDPVMALTKD